MKIFKIFIKDSLSRSYQRRSFYGTKSVAYNFIKCTGYFFVIYVKNIY